MPPAPSRPSLLPLLRHPVLFVWSCYVLLIPFYVVRGGLPQPGDLLIVFLIPMALAGWNGRLGKSSVRAFRPLLWFTIWVCVVSMAWALMLFNFSINLLYPLYYVYNAAFFFAALVLYERFGERFLRLTVQLVFISVVFQVGASFVMGGGHRSKLFFSNPNQLGYYAMLAGCVIALTSRRLGIGLLKSSIGLTCCGYLAVLSASRSSVSGILFLVALLMFANPRVLVVAALAAGALTLLDSPVESSFETLQKRVAEDRMPNNTFWEQRGYDRIYNNKMHVLFGAAEGNFWRFAESTKLGEAEIHSSVGTLIFCYGIPGVLLFASFMYQLMRGARLRFALMLMPALLYSAAHQGLRFTMLWVLFALYSALKDAPTRPKVAPRELATT